MKLQTEVSLVFRQDLFRVKLLSEVRDSQEFEWSYDACSSTAQIGENNVKIKWIFYIYENIKQLYFNALEWNEIINRTCGFGKPRKLPEMWSYT